jgi:hypothetical protein
MRGLGDRRGTRKDAGCPAGVLIHIGVIAAQASELTAVNTAQMQSALPEALAALSALRELTAVKAAQMQSLLPAVLVTLSAPSELTAVNTAQMQSAAPAAPRTPAPFA